MIEIYIEFKTKTIGIKSYCRTVKVFMVEWDFLRFGLEAERHVDGIEVLLKNIDCLAIQMQELHRQVPQTGMFIDCHYWGAPMVIGVFHPKADIFRHRSGGEGYSGETTKVNPDGTEEYIWVD